MTIIDEMHPDCGPDCGSCGMTCKRALHIDSEYASRLAFMLECLLVDPHGHWNAAAALLDKYKAEWEKVNPSPPTFMGEPMPPERKELLANALANRAKTSGSPVATPDVAVATSDVAPWMGVNPADGGESPTRCTGVNPRDVRADVRGEQE